MRTLLLALFLTPLLTHAQHVCHVSGTPSTAFDNLSHQERSQYLFRSSNRNFADTFWIPVKAHMVRLNNGTGGQDIERLKEDIWHVNRVFDTMGIQFYLCDTTVRYINNTTAYSNFVSQEPFVANDVPRVLNIYYTGNLGNGFGGYAYYPPGPARILLAYWTSPALLVHEVGHFLNLRHTHEHGNELVDGSNCTTAGDRFCDTPADPNLFQPGFMSGCDYVGNATDANGMQYHPDTRNYMSYAPIGCYSGFSQMQIAQMRFVAQHSRRQYVNDQISLRGLQHAYCSADTHVVLQGYPAGGTFTQPFVVNQAFDPSQLPLGYHTITYDLSQAGLTFTQDDWQQRQQNLSWSFTNAWQSFTTGIAGTFDSAFVRLNIPDSARLRFTMYSGVGPQVPPWVMHVDTMVLDSTQGPEWIPLPLPHWPTFQVPVGSTFTVRLQLLGGQAEWGIRLNNYNNSTSNHPWGNTNSYTLVTRMNANSYRCNTSVTRVFRVRQPIGVSLGISPDTVCSNITEVSITTSPTGGQLYVNQATDSTFSPAKYGSGAHTIQYQYTDSLGCLGTAEQGVYVRPLPALNTLNIPDLLCSEDDSFRIQFSQPVGSVTVNQDPTDWIRPGSLGPGIHRIEAFDTLGIDSVVEPNTPLQWLHYGDTVVTDTGPRWQSFRATRTEALHRVEMLFSTSGPVDFEWSLFEGIGTLGPLLHTQQESITGAYTLHYLSYPSPDIPLTHGTDYTITVRTLPGQNHSLHWAYNNQSGDPQGTSSLDGPSGTFDLSLRAYLAKGYPCVNTVQDSFEVVDPIPVFLGNDTTLLVGDSLLLTAPGGGSILWSSGTTGPSLWVSDSGLYWVAVDNGCLTSDTLILSLKPLPPDTNPINGLSERIPEHPTVSLYPVPASSEVIAEASEPLEEIILLDLQGRVVHSQTVSGEKRVHIPVRNHPPGTYILHLRTTGTGQVRLPLIIR